MANQSSVFPGASSGTTVGTPVDPASPGGILIDPATELAGTPALDDVIKGDGLGGWIIGPSPGGGGGGGPQIVVAVYAVGVVVRSLVYLRSDGLVDRVNIAGVGTSIPVVGFVSAIDTPGVGQCQVQISGSLSGFSGLTPGKLYIASKALGGIVADDNTGDANYPGDVGSGDVEHEVGYALNATTLVIGVDRDYSIK